MRNLIPLKQFSPFSNSYLSMNLVSDKFTLSKTTNKNKVVKPYMKKIILLLSIIFLIQFINAQLSPFEDTNIRVAIDGEAPIVIITSPKNISYNNETPLLVNYTIIENTLNTIWYSLNNQKNITINSFFFLSLPQGTYLLTIYANDSLKRINSSSITFKINNSVFLCSNNICDANELCSTCPQDCDSCPLPSSSSSSSSGSGGGSGGGIPLPSKKQPTEENNNQNAFYEQPKKNQTEILSEIDLNKTIKKPIDERINLRMIIWPIIVLIILLFLIIIIVILKQHKKDKQKTALKKFNSPLNNQKPIKPI